MSDYISREDALKNIARLNVSALMGNNKEVDEAIGGYNPSSFLAGLSYGLGQAMGMISGQPTLDEKEIIRKAFERVVERLEGKSRFYNSASAIDQNIRRGVKESIEIVKEEGGIE